MGQMKNVELLPPRWTAQVFPTSLQLVCGALLRAEPSHACGSCPMLSEPSMTI